MKTLSSLSNKYFLPWQVIKSKLGLVVDAYNGWFANDGLCDEAKAEAAADTISNIVSTLWLETAVKIRCEENTGFGCGWSAASSPAWVEGVEKALQAAAEDAKAKDIGFCVADITDLAAKGGIDIEASRKAVRIVSSTHANVSSCVYVLSMFLALCRRHTTSG